MVARADGTLAADVRPLVRLSVTVIAEQKGRREVGSGGGGGRSGQSRRYGRPALEDVPRQYLRLGRLCRGRWAEFVVRDAPHELCESAGADVGWKPDRRQLWRHADHCKNTGLPVGGFAATAWYRRRLDRRRAGRRHQGVVPRCLGQTARIRPDRRGGDGKTRVEQRASGPAGVNTGRSVGITPLLPLQRSRRDWRGSSLRAILTPVCRRVEHLRRLGRCSNENSTDITTKNRQRGFTNA